MWWDGTAEEEQEEGGRVTAKRGALALLPFTKKGKDLPEAAPIRRIENGLCIDTYVEKLSN